MATWAGNPAGRNFAAVAAAAVVVVVAADLVEWGGDKERAGAEAVRARPGVDRPEEREGDVTCAGTGRRVGPRGRRKLAVSAPTEAAAPTVGPDAGREAVGGRDDSRDGNLLSTPMADGV